jgi:hypothetical protein
VAAAAPPPPESEVSATVNSESKEADQAEQEAGDPPTVALGQMADRVTAALGRPKSAWISERRKSTYTRTRGDVPRRQRQRYPVTLSRRFQTRRAGLPFGSFFPFESLST